MKVKLISGKTEKSFDIQVAQNILVIEKEMKVKGWSLPEDSQYEFKDNGLIKRSSTKASKRSTEQKENKSGD